MRILVCVSNNAKEIIDYFYIIFGVIRYPGTQQSSQDNPAGQQLFDIHAPHVGQRPSH